MEENNVFETETPEVDVINLDPEDTKGPSKGFVALVVGGIAAVAVGATVAFKRHKKKKTKTTAWFEELDESCDDEMPEEEDESADDQEPEEAEE